MAGFWYRAGTISVTNASKKVVGSGTLFKTTTFKPDKGHAFYGPDGKPYEIDYVESDTVLYLVKAYTGATASGQSYEIDITRTSTIPALSSEISAQLAYAQGQYDSWQQILTGSGDVTLTAPDARQVTVPALSNMLSKSGNLAGLADKLTARNNLGLGDSATKNVGVAAGSVAAGDHIHESIITVDGDPNTYYPVRISGNGLRTGVSINRSVHDGGSWLGALRIGLRGQGYGWGGETPYIDYEFSQMWGGGVTSQGCLADVAISGAEHGVYVWLRGGRQYFLNGENVGATVYLSGAVEVNGSSFPIKSTGPLAERTSGAALDGPQLFRGPIANNMPYWNGENLPITSGTWAPYFDDPALSISNAVATWSRVGNVYNVTASMVITGAGSLAGNRAALRGLPFDFGNRFRPVSMWDSNLMSGTPNKSATAVAMATASEIQFFYKSATGASASVFQDQIRPDTNGAIELHINATIVL